MAASRRGDLPSAALVEDSTLEKTPYHRDTSHMIDQMSMSLRTGLTMSPKASSIATLATSPR